MSEVFTREDYRVLAETWSAAAKDLAEQRDALAARVAEMEKDAARYRWLKARPSLRISWYRCGGKLDPVGHLGHFDSLIDAEMQPDADGGKR